MSDEPSLTSPEHVEGGARLALTDHGTVIIEDWDGPVPGWFELRANDWPIADSDPPLLGVGAAIQSGDEVRAVFYAIQQIAALERAVVVEVDEPGPLPGTKLLVEIAESDGNRLVIDAGLNDGVTVDDVYFVLNSDAPAERFGDRIGALIEVTDVSAGTATGRVIHADTPVEAGDLAAFAQFRSDDAEHPATLVFARLSPDESGAGLDLPGIANALPELIGEFGLSNVGVELLDRYIDPKPHNAAREASESIESDQYGAVVFGELRPTYLIYNIATFGSASRASNTVGILPGGLHLPIESDVETLSRELAPSYLSTVLTMRGDDAHAAYLVEVVLRNQEFSDGVRYHLREHLALRYDELGRGDEAFAIMRDDIAGAADANLPLQQLNALSIRAYLDLDAGQREMWLSDTSEFLALADGVLPEESLGFERIAHARAMRANGERDAAQRTLEEVLVAARAQDDILLEASAVFQLALGQFDQGEPAMGALIIEELAPRAGELEGAIAWNYHLLRAEMYLALAAGDLDAGALNQRSADSLRMALESLAAALTAASDGDSPTTEAYVLSRAAEAYMIAGEPIDAVDALSEAARLYLEAGAFEDGISTLVDLGYVQLDTATRVSGNDAILLMLDAHQNFALSGELAYRLGRVVDAAGAFSLRGIIEYRLGEPETAAETLGYAAQLAMLSADYESLYEIYYQLSAFAEEAGDPNTAFELRGIAMQWAAAAGLDAEFEAIQSDSD